MEVINLGLTPEQRKRTFMYSTAKNNPYRICRFTESVYDRILLNRETSVEVKVNHREIQKLFICLLLG